MTCFISFRYNFHNSKAYSLSNLCEYLSCICAHPLLFSKAFGILSLLNHQNPQPFQGNLEISHSLLEMHLNEGVSRCDLKTHWAFTSGITSFFEMHIPGLNLRPTELEPLDVRPRKPAFKRAPMTCFFIHQSLTSTESSLGCLFFLSPFPHP